MKTYPGFVVFSSPKKKLNINWSLRIKACGFFFIWMENKNTNTRKQKRAKMAGLLAWAADVIGAGGT
jgi:hypothetical protein